jgi:hypothetical protein
MSQYCKNVIVSFVMYSVLPSSWQNGKAILSLPEQCVLRDMEWPVYSFIFTAKINLLLQTYFYTYHIAISENFFLAHV